VLLHPHAPDCLQLLLVHHQGTDIFALVKHLQTHRVCGRTTPCQACMCVCAGAAVRGACTPVQPAGPAAVHASTHLDNYQASIVMQAQQGLEQPAWACSMEQHEPGQHVCLLWATQQLPACMQPSPSVSLNTTFTSSAECSTPGLEGGASWFPI
jgi:hypothetical protein